MAKQRRGKQYRGQSFPPVVGADEVQEQAKLQERYDDPEAIPLDVYFAAQQIRDPVRQAAMRAFTKIRRATLSGWNEIFSSF